MATTAFLTSLPFISFKSDSNYSTNCFVDCIQQVGLELIPDHQSYLQLQQLALSKPEYYMHTYIRQSIFVITTHSHRYREKKKTTYPFINVSRSRLGRKWPFLHFLIQITHISFYYTYTCFTGQPLQFREISGNTTLLSSAKQF